MEKIVIVKIGSSVLLTNRQKLDLFRIDHIVGQIALLQQKGIGVVLVVSGAVASGVGDLGHAIDTVMMRQMAAGIGQAHLTSAFYQSFEKKQMQIAQVLLTNEVLEKEEKKQYIKELLGFYLNIKIVPMLNENDVIDLHSFGGNDYVASFVADLLDAGEVVILSQKQQSLFGVGGGSTKEKAAVFLTKKNIKTHIVNGKSKNIIVKTLL